MIKIVIPGEPFGKERPRHNRYTNTTYTPERTRQHEQLIVLQYKKQIGNFKFPSGSIIAMAVDAYFKIPKKTTKAMRKQILLDKVRPTVKPDWDNIGKLIADALNKVAYDDDKCIVEATVSKFYSDNPRVEVFFKEIS